MQTLLFGVIRVILKFFVYAVKNQRIYDFKYPDSFLFNIIIILLDRRTKETILSGSGSSSISIEHVPSRCESSPDFVDKISSGSSLELYTEEFSSNQDFSFEFLIVSCSCVGHKSSELSSDARLHVKLVMQNSQF